MGKLSIGLAGLVFAFARSLHGFFGFGSCCRFEPTCSQFAREALERHGALRGGWMAIHRVVRCRPGRAWGLDPVRK